MIEMLTLYSHFTGATKDTVSQEKKIGDKYESKDNIQVLELTQSGKACPASIPEVVPVIPAISGMVSLPRLGSFSLRTGERMELPRAAYALLVCRRLVRPLNVNVWTPEFPADEPPVKKLYDEAEPNWVTSWRSKS